MSDFSTFNGGLDSPASLHATVTPSDSVDLTFPCRSLRVDVAGDVAVVDAAGTVVTYTCTAGEILPIRANRVNATGTTATGIVAWW